MITKNFYRSLAIFSLFFLLLRANSGESNELVKGETSGVEKAEVAPEGNINIDSSTSQASNEAAHQKENQVPAMDLNAGLLETLSTDSQEDLRSSTGSVHKDDGLLESNSQSNSIETESMLESSELETESEVIVKKNKEIQLPNDILSREDLDMPPVPESIAECFYTPEQLNTFSNLFLPEIAAEGAGFIGPALQGCSCERTSDGQIMKPFGPYKGKQPTNIVFAKISTDEEPYGNPISGELRTIAIRAVNRISITPRSEDFGLATISEVMDFFVRLYKWTRPEINYTIDDFYIESASDNSVPQHSLAQITDYAVFYTNLRDKQKVPLQIAKIEVKKMKAIVFNIYTYLEITSVFNQQEFDDAQKKSEVSADSELVEATSDPKEKPVVLLERRCSNVPIISAAFAIWMIFSVWTL